MSELGKLNLHPPVPLAEGIASIPQTVRAVGEMQARGIFFMNQPSHIEIPLEITSLNDDELGNLLHRIDHMCGYIGEQLALYKAYADDAESVVNFTKERILTDFKAENGKSKLTVSEKDAILEVDPRVKQARDSYRFQDRLYTLTRAVRDRYQRHWETVSRRITQRGQDIERMKREGNVSNLNPQFGRVRPT